MTIMHSPNVFVVAALAAMMSIGTATGPERVQLGDVDFPHELHSVDLEIECVECHHETNATELETPHSEYFSDFWIRCSICHHDGETVSQTADCVSCHPRTPQDFADETLSAKVVVHKSCWACHEVGTGANASSTCRGCHRGGGKDGAP